MMPGISVQAMVARRVKGRRWLVLLLVYPPLLAADAMQQQLREQAAQVAGCDRNYPCLVDIQLRQGGYAVHVRRSAGISQHGILQFTTSSTWLQFDDSGGLVSKTPTP
jgi:hypothetical protein